MQQGISCGATLGVPTGPSEDCEDNDLLDEEDLLDFDAEDRDPPAVTATSGTASTTSTTRTSSEGVGGGGDRAPPHTAVSSSGSAAALVSSRSSRSASTAHHHNIISGSGSGNGMERPMPEKPPRTSSSKFVGGGGSSAKHNSSGGQQVGRSGDQYDHNDHHTFATATTASATISYSTDQGDNASDVSEAGMEVVMSKEDSMREETTMVEGVLTAMTVKELGPTARQRQMQARQQQQQMEEPYVPHTFQAGKHTFTTDRRYSMIRVVGSGAYGVVISAKDAKSEENVAIKMVPKAFSDEIDAKRILREIKLLNHFRHENIVRLVDMMPPNVRYVEDFTDVYLVADLMETDLHRIIYSKQKLSIDHVQYFIYQVLRGLKYIHSCRVLHRDLKPSNLLVNSNCDLKICDFGLARGIPGDEQREAAGRNGTLLLTEYVVTRWYRAPEIMLACHEYSYPIDVWSVGCIFAELVLRKPYFPGDDYIDQVRVCAAIDPCHTANNIARLLTLFRLDLPLSPPAAYHHFRKAREASRG